MTTKLPALCAALLLPALLAQPAAAAQSDVRNQGAVKAHVWTSAEGLESARTALRALTALSNDATAWSKPAALALVQQARGDLRFARAHERALSRTAGRSDKGAAQDLAKLDDDLNASLELVDGLRGPIQKGTGPGGVDTQADNTMLGGAAAHRDLPPGDGTGVTTDSGRGQRGGTRAERSLRNELKSAWDRLAAARTDLDQLAGDYDTTAKLPEP